MILAVLLTGCAAMGYYAQSIGGQLELTLKARRIEAVLEDKDTPEKLRKKLGTVLQIREFASREMGLPDNRSYTRYVDVRRPYVVWNVFATPELSLDPITWCFPVVGCVSYRGYFARVNADEYAGDLNRQGRDVYVGGVPAYSTLGWFSDPVPSTVMHYPAAELAGFIFHELAHQRYYVKDDTTFNESFATTVELEGVQRWLANNGDETDMSSYEIRRDRERQVMELLFRYKGKLIEVYQLEGTDDTKRKRKREIFAALKSEYRQLSVDWGGRHNFARWFGQPLNNAHLVSVVAYHEYVPAFQALLRQQHGDLQRFYHQVEEIGRLEPTVRRRRLDALLGPKRSGWLRTIPATGTAPDAR